MKTQKEPVTPVIFRKWRDGTVDAFFPYDPYDVNGFYCTVYSRIGQHSGGDLQGCIYRTKPAKPREYAALKRELKSIGYRLQVIARSSNAYQIRKSKLAA